MNKSRIFKFTQIADLAICSVWLLLIAHEDASCWMINPFILLFPALRIWISLLIKRQSKLMIVPIALLTLLASCAFFDHSPGGILLVWPWGALLTSIGALFGVDSINRVELYEVFGDVFSNILRIVGLAWLVIYPLGVYVYMRVKKQLLPGVLSIGKGVGLCAYVFVCSIVTSIVLSVSYQSSIGMAMLAFMLMLIPRIFYRNNVKDMFTRAEVAYLLALAMFAVGYVCGIGLELKSVITVCTLPAAFYALANWYVRRETTFRDILLVVGASVVFWCAQYTTNMVRLSLLFVSLALMAVAVVRFAVDTKKDWASAGLYVMAALVMPVFCLGYNPYSVLEAGRQWHFNKYYGSPDGILCVSAGETKGLRDRYGVILPIDRYDRIELLTPTKPYCKVGRDNKWQIYDIERQELVSEEWFEDVVPCDEYVYRLKSQNGDKYLSLRWYYSPYDMQLARITDEMPEKEEDE